ncbi:MAG: decarboxylating 6-phosphogluconate dehydrogenase [Chloroflexota bacterium]|nr:decarboxylating 6-phosphogluconate dehydrogenase [Chloroflexota bacterium]
MTGTAHVEEARQTATTETREIAIAGLGRMGANMARRLHRAGHRVIAFNRTPDRTREIMGEGLEGAFEPAEVARLLTPPRAVLLMVPAGDATEATMEEFAAVLSPGDTIIDGGNSNFHDSKRRHAMMKERGLNFVDAGISGGIWGLENGYATMVGGDREAVEPLEPIFRSLAPAEGGYIHAGPPGSGHYCKMVHNGIEYGIMQAYAEGFEILHASEYPLDLAEVAESWMHGSVVRSWLLELLGLSYRQHGTDLKPLDDWVADSGEGRWTVQEAIDLDVPAPIITLSLQARFRSRQDESYGAKVLAALRQQFGGHAVKEAFTAE